MKTNLNLIQGTKTSLQLSLRTILIVGIGVFAIIAGIIILIITDAGSNAKARADVTRVTGPLSNNANFNDKNIGTMTAGPNPFNENININYISEYAGNIEVLLYDMSGKLIKKKQSEVDKGANTIYLSDNQNLHPGMYLVGITQENKSTPLIKLMKSDE